MEDEHLRQERVFTLFRFEFRISDLVLCIQVQLEDALEFFGGFGVVRNAVVAGNDFLRSYGRDVGRPIGDDAVAAVRGVAFAAVADDGVEGDVFGEWEFVEGDVGAIGWGEAVDGGWEEGGGGLTLECVANGVQGFVQKLNSKGFW